MLGAPVTTRRLDRLAAGRRKALAALQRIPRRCVTSNLPEPLLSPVLKSAVWGMPRAVVEAMRDYLYNHNANSHWHYPTSIETDAIIAVSQAVAANLRRLGLPAERVVQNEPGPMQT
mgnify:CR=1 FL=1